MPTNRRGHQSRWDRAIEGCKRAALAQALYRAQGSRTEAAKILGIQRSHFLALLRMFGLQVYGERGQGGRHVQRPIPARWARSPRENPFATPKEITGPCRCSFTDSGSECLGDHPGDFCRKPAVNIWVPMMPSDSMVALYGGVMRAMLADPKSRLLCDGCAAYWEAIV